MPHCLLRKDPKLQLGVFVRPTAVELVNPRTKKSKRYDGSCNRWMQQHEKPWGVTAAVVIVQELIPRLTFVSRRANLSSSLVVKSNEKQALKKIMVPKFASVVARVQGLMGQSEEQASS